MNDGVRRLSVLMIVCCAALLLTYWLRGSQGDYGLFQLLRGEKATFSPLIHPEEEEEVSEPATKRETQKTPVVLGEVPILAMVSREQAKLAAAIAPAVVSIETEKRAPMALSINSPFYEHDWTAFEPGHGSGVIVDEEGWVITNHHVVDAAEQIIITTADQRQYAARHVGHDHVVDIAVLKIEGATDVTFPSLPFGDSEKVRQGDMVFSMGSPFGLDGTFTNGVISSARPRRISDSSPPLLQTNTVLNQGNSGGPLVNVVGQVIGINSAVYHGSSPAEETSPSYGLAIPSNTVRAVWERVRDNLERPLYGYLGVYLKEVYPHDAISLRLPNTDGCFVNGTLAGSPAYHAGLRKGDVIMRFEGQAFQGISELVQHIQESPIDQEIRLGIMREGKELEVAAVIRHPGSVDIPEPQAPLIREIWERTGLRVHYVAANERLRRGYAPSQPMVEITAIRENSAAAAKGLQPGLLIHRVDERPAQTPKEFYELIRERKDAESVLLTISAPGRKGTVPLQMPLG